MAEVGGQKKETDADSKASKSKYSLDSSKSASKYTMNPNAKPKPTLVPAKPKKPTSSKSSSSSASSVSQLKSSSHKSSKPTSGTKRPALPVSQGIPKGSVKRLMTNEEAVDRVSADAITLVAKAAVNFYAQYSYNVV